MDKGYDIRVHPELLDQAIKDPKDMDLLHKNIVKLMQTNLNVLVDKRFRFQKMGYKGECWPFEINNHSSDIWIDDRKEVCVQKVFLPENNVNGFLRYQFNINYRNTKKIHNLIKFIGHQMNNYIFVFHCNIYTY